MTSPTYCTSCGHELGVGRFCTNCGRPVPGRHPEADPPAVVPPHPAAPTTVAAPVVPPPTGDLPPAARYPLFADAAGTDAPGTDAPTVVAPAITSAPGLAPLPLAPQPGGGRAVRWVPVVVALVLLAVVAGIGAVLLLSRDDDGSAADANRQRSQQADPSAGAGSEPAQPDSTGTGGPVDPPDVDDVVALTEDLSAEVPAVAPPSRDRENRPVRFRPANMWDGRKRTAWRMPGDGTGQTLTFDLGDDVVLTEVGLVNGYAKVDGANDWYAANRRILSVQWEFDDGTRVTQDLDEVRGPQTIGVGPVETRRVRLHLLEVSAPAPGPDGRDFTAISEIRLLGER